MGYEAFHAVAAADGSLPLALSQRHAPEGVPQADAGWSALLTSRELALAARMALLSSGYGKKTEGRRAMQLGKELATGFVSDDAQATVDGQADAPPDGADAQAPADPSPAAQPEPTTAG